MERPTGQDWRNWKRSRSKARAKLGLSPNPENWGDEWRICNEDTNKHTASVAQHQPPCVDYPDSPDISFDELISRRVQDFERKRQYEESRKLINIRVEDTLPIGILHFGDPHLDDDGTDVATLMRHVDIVKSTPGLYAANVGDTRNNWVGRLSHLYSQQGTSARHAVILAEGFIKSLAGKWIYIVGGNHDCWSGEDDPLVWLAKQHDALYESSEARMKINFGYTGKSFTINARHDFKGHSQWNPTHGVAKAAQMGLRDDILICGHKHTSGYLPLRDPAEDRICHCIQVASYKVYDRYARDKGFRDQSFSPCALTIIDPDADMKSKVQLFWDAERGAAYLTWLRERRTK